MGQYKLHFCLVFRNPADPIAALRRSISTFNLDESSESESRKDFPRIQDVQEMFGSMQDTSLNRSESSKRSESSHSVVRRSDSSTRSQSLNQSPFLAGQSSSAGWGTPTVSHQIGHITPGHNLPNNHSSAGQRSSAGLWSISTGLQSLNRSKSSKRSEYFISSNKRVLLQVSVLGFCGPP